MRPTGLYDDGCSLAVEEKIDQERMWRSNICVFLLLVAPLLAYRTLPLSGFVFPHVRANNLDKLSASITQEQAGFSQSFITQKNVILLDKLLNPINGNITEMASQYVNFCDESFDVFLNERIATIDDEEGKKVYGNIRYEINSARQRKLIGFIQSLSTRSLPRVLTPSLIITEADKILRGILAAGELKKMEAKLQYHLRRAEIDMPFMVILQLNIEDAIMANVTIAVQVMKHLETLINEYQDSLVSPPVRLMRLLVRENDPNIRKQMLRQKLLIGNNVNIEQNPPVACSPSTECCNESSDHSHDHSHEHSHDHSEPEPQNTLSPQCEHIVVQAVQSWGGADVTVKDLEATIIDVLEQMTSDIESGGVNTEIQARCADLKRELEEVVAEVDAPKVSDQICDE